MFLTRLSTSLSITIILEAPSFMALTISILSSWQPYRSPYSFPLIFIVLLNARAKAFVAFNILNQLFSSLLLK